MAYFPGKEHLNSYLALGGGNLNTNFPKIQMPPGLLKLRFDWYISYDLIHKLNSPGGVLRYKRDVGVRRSLIFCTQKNTWTLYCAPTKIQDWKF